ncbi:MAG: HAMP domain-containing histidine kinase [Caulobacteraceae bacterium]|nr:HAMP domain-containing histidine kinase [Caulobacteraceae bacterium]
MIARSLRWRLLAGAAATIFAALALAWLAMSYLFEAHVERSIEANLIQHGRDIVSGLTRGADGQLALDPEPFDARFDRPSSGLYWQVSEDAAALRSRSLWDETMAPNESVSANAWTRGDVAGPFGQKLVFVAREVSFGADGSSILVMLGADHAAITAARGEFSRDLGLFLLLLWAVLAGAAWVQVQLGLKPLSDVRAALAEMRGHAGARLREADYPAEVAPLALAINALADARQRDTERARRRASDLAHSLKTPLAALAAQTRRARVAGAADAADGLDRAIEAARDAVERELTRTRIAAEHEAEHKRAGPIIDRLIAVVERTEAGQRLTFENAMGDIVLPLGEVALMELAGPLLENATRYARLLVRVSGDVACFCIEDDGPGLSDAKIGEALSRGKRLDETAQGYGLGLAIARDVAELSGGALSLDRSPLGGLRARVHWTE